MDDEAPGIQREYIQILREKGVEDGVSVVED